MSGTNNSNNVNNNSSNNSNNEKLLSLLISAAMRGSIEQVKKLIFSANIDINGVDEKGNSALHWAAYFNEPKVMELLLNASNINIRLKSKRGHTCLHLAAIADAIGSLDLLLRFGTPETNALLNDVNVWGETALHLASAAGKTDAIHMLCKAGANTSIEDNWQQTALRVAYLNLEIGARDALSEYCTNEVIEDAKHVEQSRIQLGKKTEKNLLMSSANENPIMQKNAMQENKRLMKEFMQEMKIKVKQIHENMSLEKMLVSHAFDVKGRVIDKSEAMRIRSKQQSTNAGCMTADAGTVNNAIQKKQRLGSKFEYGIGPKTLLQLEEWLMDEKIDNDGKDLFGWTALQKVIFWRKCEYISPLLDNMSEMGVNCIGGEGNTALHIALNMFLECGDVQMLQILCAHEKIEKNVQNAEGLTVLEIANKNNAKQEIIKLLS